MNAAAAEDVDLRGRGASAVALVDDDLASRVAVLSRQVRALVADRRVEAVDDDPFLGLYVSDEEADALAAENGDRVHAARWDPTPFPWPPQPGSSVDGLVDRFGLTELDAAFLVIALAPELEPRFEKLYGYLHDDLTRRRPSVGLALELAGRAFGDAAARRRLRPESPLVQRGLVVVEDPTRPQLSRPLRVSDRVVAHLLGDDRMEPELTRLLVPSVRVETDAVGALASAIANGVTPLYLHDGITGVGLGLGVAAFARSGRETLCVDLAGLGPNDDALVAVAAMMREARLLGRGLVVAVPEEIGDQQPDVLRLLASGEWPVVVVGRHPWDPAWSHHPVVAESVEIASAATSASVWTAALPDVDEAALRSATCQLRLRPDQIVRSAQLATRRAHGQGRELTLDDVSHAARAQNSSRLERLARRLRPTVGWSDLVLAPECLRVLGELEVRYRNRDLVHGDWGMGGRNNRRLGVVALFAGPSGVGKTMAAEALAGALGLDLYQVNLATVVDKYIGETEKNLERIFAAAEGVNGVIFFDEADALFGKRSEVNDARDRYANVEVAYLLQRLESYEGVAVLATNLRSNIDEAFTRRLDAVVDFAEPDETLRRALWDRSLGTALPRADDVELDFLASQFHLSGGNIRNITVTAAFFASGERRPVTMFDLVRATSLEYRKLGRLCTAHEFGPWLGAVSG